MYPDGDVCISILHEPGEDKYGYEKPEERYHLGKAENWSTHTLSSRTVFCLSWLPIHTVKTIVLSVILMLSDPNDESPANLDAAKQMREQPADFKKAVQRCVRRSQECFD